MELVLHTYWCSLLLETQTLVRAFSTPMWPALSCVSLCSGDSKCDNIVYCFIIFTELICEHAFVIIKHQKEDDGHSSFLSVLTDTPSWMQN